MKRPRHEIEAGIPPHQDHVPVRGSKSDSRPQIRRQVERICEALGLEYDTLVEMHIQRGVIQTTSYALNENGSPYRDEFDRPAMTNARHVVDTTTFVGDEKDI